MLAEGVARTVLDPAMVLWQGEADIFVYSGAFSNMFVENDGIAGFFPVLCLGRSLVFSHTKPLQTGYREVSGTYLAGQCAWDRYGLDSCRMRNYRAAEAM